MKYLTDGRTTIEITMEYYDDYNNRWVDIADDFFADGNLHCTVDDTNTIVVDDLDYCVKQARDWEARRMDYSFDGTDFERVVIVRDVSNDEDVAYKFGDCYKKIRKFGENFEKAFPNCRVEKMQLSESYYKIWAKECRKYHVSKNIFHSHSLGNFPVVMVKEQTEDAVIVMATKDV